MKFNIHLWKCYCIGIFGWFIALAVLFAEKAFERPVICASIFCVCILLANMMQQLWWEPEMSHDYSTTVHIYEFVERNTYYLLIAITFFISILNKPEFAHDHIIVYSQACSMLFSVLVIALVWMPTDPGKEYRLVHLKHLKTVFYTYALSFFLIGPLEIIFSHMDKI
jgi:hypothetical protein